LKIFTPRPFTSENVAMNGIGSFTINLDANCVVFLDIKSV